MIVTIYGFVRSTPVPCRTFLLFCIICLYGKSFSQPNTLGNGQRFRTITVNDGLPQGQVRGMVQDRQGFVWIASEGLSRYDGKAFLNFKHTVGDSSSIADNDIRDLQIDDRDNLWMVSASNDVDVLNANTGKVRHISAEPAFNWFTSWTPKKIHFTVRQIGSRYFAAICDSLVAFDIKTGRRSQIKFQNGEKLMALGGIIRGDMVFATTKALYRLKGDQIQLVMNFPLFPDTVYKRWSEVLKYRKFIGKIILNRNGKWIIPSVGGIYMYDPQKNSCVYMGNPSEERISYTSVLATDGNIYFSMAAGIYKQEGDLPPRLVYGDDGQAAVPALLLADRSGVIWASTDVHGIRLFNLQQDNFHSFFNKKGFAADVLQPWVPMSAGKTYGSYDMRTAKDANGKTWLLNLVDQRQDDKFKKNYSEIYRFQTSKAIRYDLKYMGLKPVYFTLDKLNQCWLVLLDTNGFKRILIKTDLEKGTVKQFARLPGGWKENGYLTSVNNLICYLPEDELRLYDTVTANCTVFTKTQLGISGSILMALPDEHKKDILWIATKGSGIVKLDVVTGATVHFTSDNGLPNNTVYFMAPDKKGLFWCSSNKGLFRFNPNDGSVVSFTVKDGLQGNEFNRYHFFEMPDGHFVFGGTEGYTVFHPDSIYLDNYQTPVAITNIQVNNRSLEQSSYQKSGLGSDIAELVLPYDQDFLSFDFAGLQYNAPEKLRYRYMLQGVDEDWVNAGYDASAKYASIPPGHYYLKVNASNTAGEWSSYVKTLKITILPPWWRTWWMYGVYIAVLIAAGWLFLKNRLRRLQLNQQIMLKQKEAEQAQAMEETKSRFFANITHELRTPLTLILSPVQKQLQENGATYSPTLLKGVYNNSKTLLRLINQLLDMGKLEAGSMPLILSRGDIALFIESISNTFRQQAVNRNINFTYQQAAFVDDYLFDSDKLEKIVYNLLSNAFKFTLDGGSIGVAVQKLETENDKILVQISVTDSGIGISAESLPHIFNRFYQVNTSTTRRYEGTGIGLSLVKELIGLMGGKVKVLSTVGKGSVFAISLPLLVATANSNAPIVDYPAIPEEILMATNINTERNPEQESRKPLILVTEDNSELRDFIAGSLARHYDVVTASNGEAGLQVAVSELPELIVSDVMMPIMDGYEFCEKVKENQLTSHVGFIMLTAKTADDSRVSGLRLGADHYLGKPFNMEELLLIISNLLGRQEKLREHYNRQLQPFEQLPPVKEVEDGFLRSIYTVIENNLDSDKLNVDFLASELAISRRTLNRKLSSVADTSANEIIRHYRLKKAAGLLLSGEGVSNAAYSTGFSTPSYFTQCFKEMYGITPVQYAEKNNLFQKKDRNMT